jgi:hypothetical protein
VIAMSYLTTPELPEFSKCIISFWFRVPQAALDAVQQEEDAFYAQEDTSDPPPFLGLVPLLVFGKDGTEASKIETTNSPTPHTEVHSLHSCATVDAVYSNTWPIACVSWGTRCDDSVRESHWSEVSVSYSAKAGKPAPPSYVAINGKGYLRINLESAKMATVAGFCAITQGSSDHTTSGHTDLCCYYPLASGCSSGTQCIGDPLPGTMCGLLIWVLGLIGLHLATAVADNCVIQGSSGNEFVEGTAEYGPVPVDFGTGAIGVTVPKGEGSKALAGDAWHHVLISADMTAGAVSSGGGGISASCILYVAVDDKDYKTGVYPLEDTNKVVPAGCAFVTNMPGGKNCGPGSYSLKDMKVPAAPVGIPCVEKYADKIHKVQMAELLFFTDVDVLDTSKEANRRLFITEPDKKKFQHPTNTAPLFVPIRKFAIGDPFYWEDGADNPAFAPPLFDPSLWPTGVKLPGTEKGKIANIDFTKCTWNWEMGLNLGTLKGKVVRTGKIKDYDVKDPPRITASGS